MTFLDKKYHPAIVVISIILLCSMQITIPLRQAQAIIVEDFLNLAINIPTWIEAILDAIVQAAKWVIEQWEKVEVYARNYILKPLMRILIFAAVKAITDETVNWITGNGGDDVGFVKNLEEQIRNEADYRAGEFLNHIAGIDICSIDIRNHLNIQLGIHIGAGYERLNEQLSCKLSTAIRNVRSFYDDFSNGSWESLINISFIPEHNANGAYLIAKANFDNAQSSKVNQMDKNMQANKGFLGVRVTKQSKKCDVLPGYTDPFTGDVIPPHENCKMEDVATTPGGLVADALSGSMVNNGPNALMSSDEVSGIIDGALTQIAQAVVQKLVSTGVDLFTP